MESSSPLTSPEFKKNHRQSQGDLLKILLALIIGLGGATGYFFYYQNQTEKKQAAARIAQEAAEKVRPHDEVKALIQQLQKSGHDLPRCPVIFPLLNKDKKLNNLGSYISYLSMYQAACLPEAEFNLSEIGTIFQTYALFETAPFDVQKYYRKGMTEDFQAKDFGEGTLSKNTKGYKISIRFWGTHPEKKYQKQFDKKSLHTAPTWIALCLHEWVGFTDTPTQLAYLNQPVFSTDEDLIKSANVEMLRRYCPGLICGWDSVLSRNSDSTRVFITQMAVLDDREGKASVDETKIRLTKFPNDDNLKYFYAEELNKDKRYEEANKVYFDLLLRDANNTRAYSEAIKNLEGWNFNEEAALLAQVWCERHPENPEAWLQKVRFYSDWAYLARGGGWATTVSQENWKLYNNRIALTAEAEKTALKVGPQNGKIWATQEQLGGQDEKDPLKQIDKYFKKATYFAPAYLYPYELYSNFLMPRYYGTDKKAHAFLVKYYKKDPLMVFDIGITNFWDYQDVHSVEERKEQVKRVTKMMKHSIYLGIFQKGMKEYFHQHPYDAAKWGSYIYWMEPLHQRDAIFADARKVIPQDNPELKALYPTIVLNGLDSQYRYYYGENPHPPYNEWPDVIKLKGEALRALVKADPTNMNYWNRLGCFDLDNKFYQEAKKCYDVIGDKRDETVWNKFKFTKGKQTVLDNIQ